MADMDQLKGTLAAVDEVQRRKRIRFAISTAGFCSLLFVENLLGVGFWPSMFINLAWLAAIDLGMNSWVMRPLDVS